MGGFEGADHFNAHGKPLDMARATGHTRLLRKDYERAAAIGLGCVRESIGWRLAEPSPGHFDFRRAQRMAGQARECGLQVLWTFMHYGTPADISLFDDALVERFARFAAEAARALKPLSERPPVYNLINEIGYLSWAASQTNLIHPYRGDVAGRGERTEASGYGLKRRLVRAVLAGMVAVRRVDPRARFLHVEPLVHVVAPVAQPELRALAARIAGYQWQVWDMLAGRLDPALGGHAQALDLIGINHYHSGQWEAGTERRLHWHEHDPRRKPLSHLLREAWQRYRRPLIVAETSHFGSGRAAWLNEVAHEVQSACDSGVPVQGLCLYPLIDRFDWDDARHWHHSGLWDVAEAGGEVARPLTRVINNDYAAALRAWQAQLPRPFTTGLPMTHLIVFSHLRWNFVYQRPQHLLSRLARHYRVVFIEEPLHGDGPSRLERNPQGPNLEVLTPHTPIAAPGFHDDQLAALRPLLADYLREQGIDDYAVWFYTPMALPLITDLRPRVVVYDCMDELSAFKDAPRQLRQREAALFKIAQLVFTGGPALYDAKRGMHAHVHCLPSAVDASHFAPDRLVHDSHEASEARQLQATLPRPRLGYFGVIDERLDLALIEQVAQARPDWQLVMVGPVAKIDPESLPQRPNIHWLGMQPYARLPYLMAEWDVCLMPFALNEATRFISPTKTLEYLAGEKSVVSTPVHDVVALYGDVVSVADKPAEFVQACETALAETRQRRSRRLMGMLATVFRSSWDHTADVVHEMLAAELAKAPRGAPVVAELLPAAPVATSIAPSGARQLRRARHVIVGAGPTGLAAAYELGQGAARSDTLLIEREQRVGGWCRSIEQDGFTFDCAGHIMFSNDAYVLDLYQRLLGDNLHWQNREAWVWSHGTYTRYPFQGSLHGLPPKVLKECLVGAIEARFGPIKGNATAAAKPSEPPANFEEFIHRVWGAGIARHFATPYNRKLWAVPLAEMETSWLGGRVPLPDLEQMIEGALEPTPAPMGPNARFGYPLRGGFQALMNGFLPLLNCELSLKTSVLQVSPRQRTLRLDDGRSIGFDSLISTMPLPRLVEACGEEAPAEVRAAAQALRHVSVRCVNLGVRVGGGRERLTDKHWVYYPEDTVFHRIFVQGNASPYCSPEGSCGLTCEISYGPQKPLPCEGAELIERAIADCRRVGMIGEDDTVVSAGQVDMPCAYVVYDHARAANVALIREWLAGFDIVLAGRYSEWEYYNSDHAFLAGRKAAEQSRRVLGSSRWAKAG
jgi:UDP-galactopyranose mutase